MKSVLASQDTHQDSDDSEFGTVQRESTLSTVIYNVCIKFLRFVIGGGVTPVLDMGQDQWQD